MSYPSQPRLHAGELAIAIVGEILDPRRHDVLGDAPPGAHFGRLGQSRLQVRRHGRGVDQQGRLLTELGKALARGLRGVREGSDVGIFANVICPQEIDRGFGQLVQVVIERETHESHRALQPLQMLPQTERCRARHRRRRRPEFPRTRLRRSTSQAR